MFIPLVQDFVEKRVSAQDFETRYFRLVREYPGKLDARVSKAVNYLFCEVDALVLDERLSDPDDPDQIDEATLWMCAKHALRSLIRVGEAADIDDSVESLFTASHSEDWDTRDRAAFLLAAWLPHPDIEQRLIEMLHDVNIAVQVSATESLVTQGERSAILAVLRDFGERIDDPDTYSMATKLHELQGCGSAPILQQARAILAEGTTPSVEAGIREVERLFGHLR
ncbi:colicin immunity domain-containing protein [Rhodococcoides yunnanense]|uniref:colicin immunity domain-containing protein n=1 Tax=Rhodococcoides yunnanense TaxID=278209 RepID=UPI000932F676|nr:colicin immunity domain-containing protein [Rhodococcus yunnanensis]